MNTIFRNILADTPFVAVDIGAAHWLPSHWALYQSEFDFVLIEPDQDACRQLHGVVATLPAEVASRYRIVPQGVSQYGGERTLYRTNTPTGSSLLKPKALAGEDYFENYYDLDSQEYFLPVTELTINTVTLQTALEQAGRNAPHMIKLDTQGTELEILRGLSNASLNELTTVQAEIGMPGGYLEQPGLDDFIVFMREQNFVLFDIQPSRTAMPYRGRRDGFSAVMETGEINGVQTVIPRLWEVEGVFMRDPMHLLRNKDKSGLRRLMVGLCVYRMFPEAFQIATLAESQGIFSYVEAVSFKREIIDCNQRLAAALRSGYRIYW